MTGADAVVDVLVKHGVSTLFGLPGIQLDPLFNAFYDARSRPRVINARHEQGVAYIALGFAQATGGPASMPASRVQVFSTRRRRCRPLMRVTHRSSRS